MNLTDRVALELYRWFGELHTSESIEKAAKAIVRIIDESCKPESHPPAKTAGDVQRNPGE